MDTTRQSPNQGTPRRILVRAVNWLGDAVMTTPALQRVRERFPKDCVALLTDEKLADLWLHHPSVDQVITFNSRENPWSVARRLRPNAFDTALIFPNSPRSALEAWLARIPERIGYARAWRNYFLTQALPPRLGRMPMRKRTVREIRRLVATSPAGSSPTTVEPESPAPLCHQIHEYLHLTAALGADPNPLHPRLKVVADEIRQAEATWRSGLETKHAIPLGLSPSAAYGPAKRWPAENFVAAARELSRILKQAVWLVFGTASDRQLCEEIAHRAAGRILNLAGKTSLREFMGLLRVCRVVLTNDSGPMHIAAALGTPVVVPFGSTSPKLTGPGLPGTTAQYLLESGVPCAPCYRRVCPIDFRCMKTITVERVVGAVLRAIEDQNPSRGSPCSGGL